MKVKCTGCSKVLNIPDDKIPSGETKQITCPNCKTKLNVSRDELSDSGSGVLPEMGDIPETTPVPRPLDETQDVPLPPPSAAGGDSPFTMEDFVESGLDMLGEGKFRALVADKDNMDRIAPVLKKMQYVITAPDDHEEAIQKVTFNEYDLVIINEKFEGADPNNNALHKHIEELSMEDRRKIFTVLVGKNFKTLDNMSAFIKSINMVMNESDFTNLELILKKGMNDNDAFYRVYRKMLVDTGKELA